MTKKKEYLIKNIKCFSNLVIFDTNKNSFCIKHEKDINKSVTSNFISKFQLKHIKGHKYEMKYKNIYLASRINVYLIFSTDKINPLFFNILLKENDDYYIINISLVEFGNKIMECGPNEKLYSEKVPIKDINEIKFNENPKYIFYFSNVNHELCKVRLNNKEYSLYGFNKHPVVNKSLINDNETFCYYNPDLMNSWKVDLLKNPSCKHIKLDRNDKNEITKILNKCSVRGGYHSLLRPLLTDKEVVKKYKYELRTQHAGVVKMTIDEKNNSIQDKIGNKKTKNELNDINNNLDPDSKVELANVLTNFSNYLDKGNFDNMSQAQEKFSNVLKTVKERNSEYLLAAKYKICKGNLISELNDVSNVIDCMSHCNADVKCKNISYNKLDKKCNLYKNCRLLPDDKYSSYTKKSLLRESGYNIYESYQTWFEPVVNQMPPYLKLFYYISAIIIIICLSILLYRFLKIFIKIFMCIYYGNCYSPTELLDLSSNGILDKRYI